MKNIRELQNHRSGDAANVERILDLIQSLTPDEKESLWQFIEARYSKSA